ncbi:apolipoprotein M-like [Scyliorhinus canicula]|uniref:apolipoprotein M-like n=1 Tax=Scyliorhinus canicula TaxID=7830 RepID=UPI0018F2E3BB|nr:apolipoprotein M-like [Scyliorhinus canicula]
MLQELWKIFFYLVFLFRQCKYDERVTAGNLNRTQYAGKWFFLAVAAESKDSLVKFNAMDSAAFLLAPVKDSQTLQLKAEMRLSQSMECMFRHWTYHISNETQELTLDGQPYLKTEIFVKKDNECIMFLETQDKGSETFRRLMLYGRSPTMTEYGRQEFEHRAKCMNLSDIFVLKQSREPCEI